MKTKIAVLIASSILAGACANTLQTQVSNTNTTIVSTANAAVKSDNSLVVSSHSKTPSAAPSNVPASGSNPSSSGGSPMAKAIDVSEMTAKIEKADKEFKAKPTDAKAKDELSKAYFERAVALTGAAQYRAALGDLRKCLKLDPNNTEAKDMLDQSVQIFESLGREVPKEGAEPTPLPFDKK